MKFALTLSLFAASIGVAAAAEDLPKPFTFARYQSMMDRSPFAVATAAAPVAAAPSFAKDLYIANAARSPDGDLVTVASSADKNFKKYLTTKAPVDGFNVSNIEWSEKVGATKVTITKDGQFATLTFNQALLSQPIASAQTLPQPQLNQPQPMQPTIQPAPIPSLPIPNAGIPQAVPPVPGLAKPMPVPSIPTLPTPPTRVRSTIQRNPGVNGQPPPANPSPQAEL